MATQTFTYTQDKSTYLPIALLFGLLCLAESVVLTFLAVHLLSEQWQGLALILCFLLLVLVARVLSAPLFTRHRWRQDGLEVHYGTQRWQIHRDWIASVEAIHESLTGLEPLAGRFDEDSGRLTACFSEQGQLLIRLKHPQQFQIGFGKRAETDTVLINTDQADQLQALLGFTEEETVDAAPEPTPLPAPNPKRRNQDEPPVLAIHGLTRRFGAMTAVDQMDLEVAPGEIVALLGGNGAGKTTTIKMITGLLEPDAGQVTVKGFDLWCNALDAKHHFGYVPDHAAFYGMLSGREQLQFLAQLRGLPQAESEAEIDALLTQLDLAQDQDRSNETYSLGMKRKLSLAAAMLHQPALLILDEPFNGLDPWASQQLKTMLSACREQGTAILLSTHDLATAEKFCDRVAMLHRGRKIVDQTVSSLCEEHGDLEQAFFAMGR